MLLRQQRQRLRTRQRALLPNGDETKEWKFMLKLKQKLFSFRRFCAPLAIPSPILLLLLSFCESGGSLLRKVRNRPHVNL